MAYDVYRGPVASAPASARAEFIRKTYLHLAGAVLAFIALEWLLLSWNGSRGLVEAMLGRSWLLVLAAFMGVSYVADRWARSDTSRGMQYLGLGLYVVAEAIIFLPLMTVAAFYSDPAVIPGSAIMTGLLFAGLTFTAVTSGVDFSFLRSALIIGGFVGLGLIVASVLFGFSLGIIFSLVMVGLAAASILYTTSNILRYYRTDQYVAASLSLFAAVALLYFYIVRILTRR
ncbi:MAG: Bax inhibitor-1 family protein [Chloroflexota bacterium]|nr:Bax inhibitor-1 family protein [Chloroflexota bacterium]